MTLPALFERAVVFAEGVFRDMGDVPTAFIAIDPQERLHLLVSNGEFPEKRDRFMNVLQVYVIAHKITAYAFASGAWMSKVMADDVRVDGTHIYSKVIPREDPKRTEVMIIGAVDDDNHAMAKIYEIQRRPNKMGAEMPNLTRDERNSFFKHTGLFSLLVGVHEANTQAVPRSLLHGLLEHPSFKAMFPCQKIATPAEYESSCN